MAIGIDPKVDFAFKQVLGSPDHPRLTVHFLNAVLRGEPPITQVEILNPYLEKEYEGDKPVWLDLRARDESGRWLNVEMQTTRPTGLEQRLTFYAASLYVSQLNEGESYVRLRPAISICVLDANIFSQRPEVHSDILLRTQDGQTLTRDFQIHTVELPKYARPADNSEVIRDPLEQWVYFFRFAATSTPEDLAERLVDDEFKEAIGVLEMISKTPEERSLYEARLKFQRDTRAQIDFAREEGEAKGRMEGEAKGRREGEAIGRREGEAQGRMEGEAKGRMEGELIGQILLLQNLRGIQEHTREQLIDLDLATLESLVRELRRKPDSEIE